MPLSRDEFERRLSNAFAFLGDLLRNPERIEQLPDVVRIPGVSIALGEVSVSPGFIITCRTEASSAVVYGRSYLGTYYVSRDAGGMSTVIGHPAGGRREQVHVTVPARADRPSIHTTAAAGER